MFPNPYEAPQSQGSKEEQPIKEEVGDGGNAFPSMLPGGNYQTTGMSLLDWFAGQALSDMVGAGYAKIDTFEKYAKEAYNYAEAMIEEKRRRES